MIRKGSLDDLYRDMGSKNIRPMDYYYDFTPSDLMFTAQDDLKSFGEQKLNRLRLLGYVPEITRINKKNIDAFKGLISDDIKEQLILPDVFGIGAISEIFDAPEAAGSLIYRIHDVGGERYCEILWLFVSLDRRGMGCATAMMASLFDVLGKNGINSVLFDLPTDEKYRDLAEFLSGWEFAFSLFLQDRFYGNVGGLLENKMLTAADRHSGIASLHSLEIMTVKKVWKNIIKKHGNAESARFLSCSDKWIEKDISTALLDKSGKIVGLFLIHATPSKKLVPFFYGGDGVDGEHMVYMLAGSAMLASKKYGNDAIVDIRFTDERFVNLLGKLFPNRGLVSVVRGVTTRG